VAPRPGNHCSRTGLGVASKSSGEYVRATASSSTTPYAHQPAWSIAFSWEALTPGSTASVTAIATARWARGSFSSSPRQMSQQTRPHVMSSDGGETVTEAERVWGVYIDAWNTHDIDAIVEVVAEQLVYDERPMTMSGPIHGRLAFRQYLKSVFKMFPDLRIQTTLCDTGSSVAVAESLMRGTYAGSAGIRLGRGRQISARVACVFEVAGGRLTHERLYWDRANTMRQLGLLPAIANAATTQAVTLS